MSMNMSMCTRIGRGREGMGMALWALLGLAACNSDDAPADGTDSDTAVGTTSTGPTTSADTTAGGNEDCGNGMIDEGEECDGSELGGAQCTDVNPAFTDGTLACGASCTFDASGCTLPPDTPLVTLNEVTSDQVLIGEFVGTNDAIELHNAGTGPADLSGWRLSDDPMLLPEMTYVVPEGTMLEPGDFMVLRSFDDITMTGELPFGLDAQGVETLVMVDGADAMVDSVTVDGYLARVSYCRVPDATGPWFQCDQTFGSENQEADTACGNGVLEAPEPCDGTELGDNTCESLGLGFSGGTLTCKQTCNLDADACTTDSTLVLNELSSTTDQIEIFNGGAAEVDLGGLVLTDDNVDATYDVTLDTAELAFAAGTVVPPNGYLVISQGVGPGQHPFGLGAMGDRLTLVDPAGPTIIDQTQFADGQAAVSWCRQPNGPGGAWETCAPSSMGSAN